VFTINGLLNHAYRREWRAIEEGRREREGERGIWTREYRIIYRGIGSAFSSSYDLPTPFLISRLSFSVFLCVASRDS
jgi:hypothetical protein